MKMNKKIITMLVTGALLVGVAGTATVSACSSESSDSTKATINRESTEGRGIPKNHEGEGRKGALAAYAEMSGMEVEEIETYLQDNDMSLKDLITENGDLEEFEENCQR